MTRGSRSRKLVRYQRDQAQAAQQMARQNARVSEAQTGYLWTQTQIAAQEAEARRIAGLPLTCAHCRRTNPPRSSACSHCGSMAFLPPDGRYPASAPPRPSSAWGKFRATSTTTQTWSWIVAGVLVLALFGALAGTSTPSTATATGPAPNAPVVLTLAGHGDDKFTPSDKISPNFTVKDPWRISYTYDCGGGGQETGRFALTLDNLAGRNFTDDPVPVSVLGARGVASKVEHSAGTYYLRVSSTCSWTLKITG